MLTKENIDYKWIEIKGGVRNLWSRLSLEEIESAKYNLKGLAVSVREKHNESYESFKAKLDALMDSFDNVSDKGISENVSSYERAPVKHENYAKNMPSSSIQPAMDNYNPESETSDGDPSSR